MSINIQRLFEQFVQAEALSDSPRIRAAWMQSANRTINDLNTLAFQELDEITDIDGVTLDLDAAYGTVLLDGIKRHIQDTGEWTKDPNPVAVSRYEKALGQARMIYWKTNPPWEGSHGGALSDE